jgi:hypothetical protein
MHGSRAATLSPLSTRTWVCSRKKDFCNDLTACNRPNGLPGLHRPSDCSTYAACAAPLRWRRVGGSKPGSEAAGPQFNHLRSPVASRRIKACAGVALNADLATGACCATAASCRWQGDSRLHSCLLRRLNLARRPLQAPPPAGPATQPPHTAAPALCRRCGQQLSHLQPWRSLIWMPGASSSAVPTDGEVCYECCVDHRVSNDILREGPDADLDEINERWVRRLQQHPAGRQASVWARFRSTCGIHRQR